MIITQRFLNCNGFWILITESEILELNFCLNLGKLQADVDNSGTIDYGEFIAATLHLNKIEKQDHLFAAFSYFDKDGSGYITHDELQQACIEFGLDDTSLEDMIQEVDQDNVSFSHTFGSFSCNDLFRTKTRRDLPSTFRFSGRTDRLQRVRVDDAKGAPDRRRC